MLVDKLVQFKPDPKRFEVLKEVVSSYAGILVFHAPTYNVITLGNGVFVCRCVIYSVFCLLCFSVHRR